jgi:integrase/recombinase XerD
LWLSSRPPHGPIKSQVIEVMVRDYGRQLGIALTPHVWRHTCATHLVSGGANIAYIQRLLGHQSLRTTQIYARATVVDLQKTHAKAHGIA